MARRARRRDGGSGPDRIDAAVTALQESKTWPILREMDARGDYPEVVWDYADEAKAGRVPERYDGGLGFATTERTLALRVAWRRWAPRVTTRRRPARAAG